MELVVARSGCAILDPDNDHDIAGIDMTVWAPQKPGRGVRCLGIQIKSVRADSENITKSGDQWRYRLVNRAYDILRHKGSMPVALVVMLFPPGDDWLVEEPDRLLLMSERYLINLMGYPQSTYSHKTPIDLKPQDSMNSGKLRESVENAPTLLKGTP